MTGKSLPLQNNQGMISRWEGRGRGTERDSWRDGEDNAEIGKRRESCRTEAWRLASILKKRKKGEDEKGKAQKQRNKASGRADPDREEDDKVFT